MIINSAIRSGVILEPRTIDWGRPAILGRLNHKRKGMKWSKRKPKTFEQLFKVLMKGHPI
jgi:hypothetical protein